MQHGVEAAEAGHGLASSGTTSPSALLVAACSSGPAAKNSQR
ncbi:hypothetical protein ACFQU2_00900 [Siccirubricoccus deserti]